MLTVNELETISYKRLGILLIIIGIFLAINSYLGFSGYKLWPVLSLSLGLAFIGIFRNHREAIYLAIGVYIVSFSFLALYCNFTLWGNLAYLWPLFITFLGIVFITLFFYYKKKPILLFIGFLLLVLSVFFFLVFSVSAQLWWTIFIFVGLCILLSVKSK